MEGLAVKYDTESDIDSYPACNMALTLCNAQHGIRRGWFGFVFAVAVVVHPCRFASSLVFAPALSCGDGHR